MNEMRTEGTPARVPAAGKPRRRSASRARSVAFCGLSVALLAVCAWVTVPLGPVPFTLQIFAAVFALCALSPRECLAVFAIYLLMGTVGLPVFSGMRGGIGVIAGPSGGFLWGYLVGAAVAVAARVALARLAAAVGKESQRAACSPVVEGHAHAAFAKGCAPSLAVDIVTGALFVMVAYACGCAWYMFVAQVDLAAAILTSVVPFVLVDALKTVAAVLTARAVRKAVR